MALGSPHREDTSMNNIKRAAALTLAVGSSVALMAGPAGAAGGANQKGTLQSCLTTAVAASANFSLTADGPNFKQAFARPKAGGQCATWTVKVGQYVMDVSENTACTFTTATVTRDGRAKTLG